MKTSKLKLNLVRALLAWFGENARDLPWRRTRDPYAIWISEIMLRQTQVKTVTPYWERWMKALPDARALARARPAQTRKLWEGLGYYARARNAHAAARVMVAKHGGQFPKTFAEALALPGVGRYTAGAVCSIAYNLPTPVLDGNVTRVLSRVFGVAGDPRGKEARERLWGLAEELVRISAVVPLRGTMADKADCLPSARSTVGMAKVEGPAKEGGKSTNRNCGRLNEALMELGALICAPKNPQCAVCPLRTRCFARRENRVGEFPMLKPAEKLVRQRFMAFIVKKNGRFLARQRPAGGVNARLWEFPNVEIAPEERNPAAAAPFVLTGTKPFFRVRHTITRHRILLEAHRAQWPRQAAKGVAPGVWRTVAQLDRLAFTSAHRKILTALQDEIKLENRAGMD